LYFHPNSSLIRDSVQYYHPIQMSAEREPTQCDNAKSMVADVQHHTSLSVSL
jgi:hypothetical protein